jgi:hypothetical protein
MSDKRGSHGGLRPRSGRKSNAEKGLPPARYGSILLRVETDLADWWRGLTQEEKRLYQDAWRQQLREAYTRALIV